MDVISDGYRQLCEDMHMSHPWGTKGFKYIDEFMPMYRQLNCRTLLDYGCGSGTVKQHLLRLAPDVEVRQYDPAIPAHAAEPEPADFVVCTDVMEHVEVKYVDNVLAHICALMRHGGYMHIALTKAKRCLPDGSNAHITIRPVDWWLVRVAQHSWTVADTVVGRKSLKLHIRR